jgi:hypothetical protein
MTDLISKSDFCRGWKFRHFFCEAVINMEKTCEWTFVMGSIGVSFEGFEWFLPCTVENFKMMS